MHPTCQSKLSSSSVIPYEIAIKRFSINTKRAGDNKMSRKSDSVSPPPLSVSLWAQHFGEMPTRKGKENGPDFYQAIKSAMSSECPVPPCPVAAAGLVKSQRNAQVSVTSSLSRTSNHPHSRTTTSNHPPTYAGQAFQYSHLPSPLSPGYPLVHSALLMVILKRA